MDLKNVKINRIILEGADQQGKSTCREFLENILGWDSISFGPPGKDFNFHGDYLIPERCISDRNYLSEIAYRRLMGLPHRIVNRQMLENIMRPNTLFVLMDRGDDYQYTHRDELFSQQEILKVREIYREIWEDLDMLKIKVNPHDHSHNTFFNIINQIKNGHH